MARIAMNRDFSLYSEQKPNRGHFSDELATRSNADAMIHVPLNPKAAVHVQVVDISHAGLMC